MIINRLRQLHRYWDQKKVARDNAKVQIEVGTYKNGNPKYHTMYKCAHCFEVFERQDTQMDHIEPVVELEMGFVDWNTYVERLFCNAENYQCLCKGCHKIKTNLEKELRKEYRNKKKLDI